MTTTHIDYVIVVVTVAADDDEVSLKSTAMVLENSENR